MSAVRRLTRASVTNAAATLAVLIPATIAFGLAGTIASVLIGSVVQSVVYIGELWLAYRERRWRLAAVRGARSESRLLLGFGTVLLLGGIANWGSLLVVRTVLVRTLGELDNGLYQAVFGFSSQYIAMFMTWMAAYVFPRIAARGTHQLDELLNSGLRANLFLMVPVLCVVAALRDPLIHVLYSRAFVAAAPLVPVQVLGDYVRVVGWSMGVAFFALGRVRTHLLLIAGQNALWVLLAVGLMPHLGLQGVAVAYALSFVSWPLLAFPMLRTWFGFRLTGASWRLTGAGLAAVVVAGFLPQPLGAVAIPVVPLLVVLQRRLVASKANTGL
jgi:PST family polysaccharide transporter